MTLATQFRTHEVTNQARPLANYNAVTTDPALLATQQAFSANWASENVSRFGALAGGEMIELGFEANRYKPEIKSFDRFGHRLDEVVFHPSYHRLMQLGVEHGVSNFAWRHEATEGAHVARAALLYLHGQVESGTCCPLTMTHASVPSLRLAPQLAQTWVPKIIAPHYEAQLRNPLEKAGITVGMGMTEKQGGSDVRANTTRAHLLSTGLSTSESAVYEIVGHKWFFSAPMCDAFLVLAHLPEGLSCFFMPRVWPDGTTQGARNEIRIQRLKDKLGNWSNASSEVEFTGAKAWLVGQPGRGIANILEMVALTRLDCMLGSLGIMRQALVQAIHHTRQRHAFGKALVEHGLMQNVLADMALENEATLWLAMRTAYAVDRAPHSEHEAALARIITAIGKYWICKRCTPLVNEAQECLGGAGYVEESFMPRLLREAPLNSIWEGSGNVQCLDVLRALSREPQSAQALMETLASAKGHDVSYDQALAAFQQAMDYAAKSGLAGNTMEVQARRLVEHMALLLQASLLIKHAPNEVSAAYVESRLTNRHSAMFGTLPSGRGLKSLIDRAFAT